jgi:NAD(P)-dependent dehydrogenase (short-subunit alcohol dehydrogenase family)
MLAGQTILVTGATGAIGQAICRALGAEGARLVIHYGRNRAAADRLLAEIGGAGSVLPVDLALPEAATALWDAAIRAEGRITGLVNNAGIRSEVALTAALPDWQAVWEREFRVNLFAAADLTRAAILHFRGIGGGRIVNMASRAGQRGYASTAMAYGASKAALINLTKSVAQSHGHEGVTAVALAPGWVRTDMAEAYIAQHGEAAALAGIPIGRMATPDEIGALTAFLFRPAQVSLNGAVLDVNGGSYLRYPMRFQDRIIIVTGAAGGIGRAIARRFAAEGGRVILTDANAEGVEAAAAAIRAEGGAARGLAADIATAEGCKAVIADALAQEGRVDVLCNNAGINRRGPLLALTDEDWRLSFAVNLDAMFHLCRAVLPTMIAEGGGAIVNTASQWGLHPAPNHIAYNVTKAAVASFTQNLARDYAPQKVRVNAVCPGEIHTPMLEAGVMRSGRTIADLDRLVPFGRIGRPEEVAALVAFLASDEAAFICGSLVEITGAQAVA